MLHTCYRHTHVGRHVSRTGNGSLSWQSDTSSCVSAAPYRTEHSTAALLL